ncbi:hypothetical protein [Glaesserella sp.]|uniref:hypothetical protein n=1 Tax=Glaesserella sp. TaxID=2094731 RepID=UPI0035A1BF3E
MRNTHNKKMAGSRLALNTSLTALACLVSGVLSGQVQAATVYGCEVSFYSSDNANGCSASTSLNQQLDGSIYGGFSTKGEASNNNVTISHGSYVKGYVTGGNSEDKETNHNQVVIGNNVIIGKNGRGEGGSVWGGSSIKSTSDFNAVRIGSNVTVEGYVNGGSAGDTNTAVKNNVTADSNSVHIGDASTITGSVWGGNGGKSASFNEVYIGNGVKIGPEVSITNGAGITGGTVSIEADFLETEANSNVVNIGDNVAVSTIIGGNSASDGFASIGTSKDNRVIIGNYSNTIFVSAAEGSANSTVANNSVMIGNDAKTSQVYGARTASGSVTNSTVSIGHNLKADRVFGGDAYSAIAGEGNSHNNSVIIGENATVNELVVGGNALTKANNNSVLIHKGFNVSGVAGGVAQNETINNTVTLFAGTVQNNIVGGTSSNVKGNTLNLGTANEGIEMNKLSAKEVLNFETINFYLPENVRNNDTALKLSTMYLDLGNTTMNAYVPGNADLQAGNVVHLIQTNYENALQWSGKGNVYQGVTLVHNLATVALDAQSKSLDLTFNRSSKQTSSNSSTVTNNTTTNTTTNSNTTVVVNTNTTSNAVVNTNTSTNNANSSSTTATTTVNPQTKSLMQGRLVGSALVNSGATYLADGLNSLYQSTNLAGAGNDAQTFGQVSGVNRDVTTGSYVSLKGAAIDLGRAWNQAYSSGNWLYGVAAEYGYSRYTAHLDDGTEGKGSAWYLGANAFSNYLWSNGFYVQGSLRAGRVSSKYYSYDFNHVYGNYVRYTSRSTYVAGHVGLGKVWQLGNQNSLDTYVKYFDSYTSSDSAQLSTGETYDFSSVHSKRARIGAQYNHNLDNWGMHFGVAYERELNGNVRAHYQGNGLPTPTMKGGTTIGEVGVNYQQGGKTFNAAVQGFGGRQQGVSLNLGIKF